MDPNEIFSTLRTATAGLRFSLVVLLALAANFMWAEGHDQQRCIELVVLALALGGALGAGIVPRALQAVPVRIRGALLAFFLLGALATVGAFSPRHALAEWAIFVMLGLAAIVIAAELTAAGASGQDRMLQAIVWICALYSLRVLLVYCAAISTGVQINYHALAAGFSNFRFLNNTQTALLPMLLLLGVSTPRARRVRGAVFLLVSFWWALLFFAEARASMLGLFAGMGAALLARRGAAMPLLKWMAATALAGIGLYLVLFFMVPLAVGMAPLGVLGEVFARSAADPASGRQFLWLRALQLIAQHPLLGAGPQQFAHFGADLHNGAHPHDWILQIAAEWGVPACLCLLYVLAAGARALLRAGGAIAPDDRRNQAICTGMIVSVTGILVDSLLSGVLVMPQSQLALVLVFGMATGWVRSREAPEAPRASGLTRYLGSLAIPLALCVLAITVGPDLERKWNGAALTAQEQALNLGAHWPRLWEAGYF